MASILIKNGRVWDGEQFLYADVLTDGGRLSKIEPHISEKAEFVYDAAGKTVAPGLVDLHVHMRGINKKFGTHAELSSIPFGVTAAADACGAYGDKALLDTFLLKNVIFVPAQFQNNKACFNPTEEMIEKYGEKVVGIKVYFDTQVSDIQDIKPLCEVVEFAEKKNLMIMVHSSNSPVSMRELLAVLRKGDILTHAYHGGKNNVSESHYECIKEAKRRGVAEAEPTINGIADYWKISKK
jgi:dihydroorotase